MGLRKINKIQKKHYHLFHGMISLFFIVVLILTTAGNVLDHPRAHAFTQPSTPTIPLCGARSASDVQQYTGPTLPNPAYVSYLSPSGNNGAITYYRYWPGSSGVDPRWYIEQQNGTTTSENFYIYDATTNALINNFTINIPTNLQGSAILSTFTLDSAGNIYIGTYAINGGGGSVSQWLWSPGQTSATEGWATIAPGLIEGAMYSYTTSAGVAVIAAVSGNPNSSNPNAQAYSDLFNVSNGDLIGTNPIIGNDVQTATAHNNDLVVLSYSTNTVSIWNSTASTQTFYMSAGANPNWSGALSGANELANGDIIVTSYQNRLVAVFNSTGGIVGIIHADRGAGDPLNDPDPTSPIEVVNNNIYYLAGNPYSSPNYLTYFTTTTEAEYMSAPQGAPFELGLGAYASTSATDNYFPSGTTPNVSVNFNQWWQNIASDYTGSYSVMNINQILAGQSVAASSFSIPSAASDYSTNGNASVSLNLPAAVPGVYEVNIQLSQGSTVTGATCAIYTVGAANDTFNPNTLPSSGDTQGIALAAAFGQKLYRSSYTLDACFPGVTTPTSTTTLNCPSSMISDIQSAATLAQQDGITYEIQLGTGTAFDNNAVSSGQWQRLLNLMVSEFPEVTNWECWNEPDNTLSSASYYVTNVEEPCYNGVKSAAPNDVVIGISNENYSVSNYQSYVTAGALNYLNVVAIHGYSGWNKSYEEQGNVIPTIYNNKQTGQIQALQQYLSSQGYTGPIYDTESGFWNGTTSSPDPYEYFNQGDKIVRKMILEQSIGMNWWNNFFNSGGYNVGGNYWELVGGGTYGNILNPGGLAAINYQAMLGGRSFITWLTTGIPHTYAAEYGPSSTNNNDVVAIWADGYNVNAIPTLSGGGSLTITSEYGATSTLNNDQALTLAGQVQYINVPSGQSLTIAPQESYGENYALLSNGASATASSSYSCGSTTVNPDVVLYGIDQAQGSNYVCGGTNGTAWSATNTDTNPTLTITLGSPQTLDRIFVSSFSLGSSLSGLRNYTVEVNNGSGTITTVANASNLFFNRSNLISFTPQTVSQIIITNIQINYSGNSNGLPPTWWSSNFNISPIYDVEAYAPGVISGTEPTNTVSMPDIVNGYTHSQAPIDVTAIDHSGTGIQKVQLYVDGTLVSTDSTSPYNFTLDTLNYLDGNYTLTIKSYDNNNDVTSTNLPIIINNGDLNNDGVVNIFDLSILASNWNKTGMDYSQGNIVGSGPINIFDLSSLARNWGWEAN